MSRLILLLLIVLVAFQLASGAEDPCCAKGKNQNSPGCDCKAKWDAILKAKSNGKTFPDCLGKGLCPTPGRPQAKFQYFCSGPDPNPFAPIGLMFATTCCEKYDYSPAPPGKSKCKDFIKPPYSPDGAGRPGGTIAINACWLDEAGVKDLCKDTAQAIEHEYQHLEDCNSDVCKPPMTQCQSDQCEARAYCSEAKCINDKKPGTNPDDLKPEGRICQYMLQVCLRREDCKGEKGYDAPKMLQCCRDLGSWGCNPKKNDTTTTTTTSTSTSGDGGDGDGWTSGGTSTGDDTSTTYEWPNTTTEVDTTTDGSSTTDDGQDPCPHPTGHPTEEGSTAGDTSTSDDGDTSTTSSSVTIDVTNENDEADSSSTSGGSGSPAENTRKRTAHRSARHGASIRIVEDCKPREIWE